MARTNFSANFSKLLILICTALFLGIITGFLTRQVKNPGQLEIALSLFNTLPACFSESSPFSEKHFKKFFMRYTL